MSQDPPDGFWNFLRSHIDNSLNLMYLLIFVVTCGCCGWAILESYIR